MNHRKNVVTVGISGPHVATCSCGWIGEPRTEIFIAETDFDDHVVDISVSEPNSVNAPAPDPVNHPPHYNAHPSGIECIQVAEHFGFNLGNCLKYIWRADHKNGVEDLKKAAWYLQREIEKRTP